MFSADLKSPKKSIKSTVRKLSKLEQEAQFMYEQHGMNLQTGGIFAGQKRYMDKKVNLTELTATTERSHKIRDSKTAWSQN